MNAIERRLGLPPLREILPNSPKEGLPTPRKWGQTWEYFENKDAAEILVVLGPPVVIGGILGAAVSVGIAGELSLSPGAHSIRATPLDIPIGFGGIAVGMGIGLAVGGVILHAIDEATT